MKENKKTNRNKQISVFFLTRLGKSLLEQYSPTLNRLALKKNSNTENRDATTFTYGFDRSLAWLS